MPTLSSRHPYRPLPAHALPPPTISVQPSDQRVRSTGVIVFSLGTGLASLGSLPVVGLAKRRKLWTFTFLGVLLVSFLLLARDQPVQGFVRRPKDDRIFGDEVRTLELSYDPANPFKTRYSLPATADRKLARRANEPLMQELMLQLRGDEAYVREAYERSLQAGEGEHEGRQGSHPLETPEGDGMDWLRDRTVLLLGDSIDRYHLLHLCQFLQPSAPLHPFPWPDAQPHDYVTIHTPTSKDTPYPSRIADLERELADLHRGGKAYGSEPSRVWTCAIDQRPGGLNALLVWAFLNGGDDGQTTPGVVPYPSEEGQEGTGEDGLVGEPTWSEAASMPFGDRAFWPVESPHFNPPLSSEDRYEQLVAPILKNLGRDKVDLVELGVGPWDLGMMRSQDTLAVQRSPETQHTNSSYVDSLAAVLSSEPLSPARLSWFSGRLAAFHAFLSERYPGRLRVRGMHMTPQWYGYPWVFDKTRIRQVQAATRAVVGEDPLRGGTAGWETIIEGKGEWLDHIHPGPIPASWVWADLMLNDLKRLVTSKMN